MRKVGALVFVLSLWPLLSSCQSEDRSSDIRVTMAPGSASVVVTQSVQFTAKVFNAGNPGIIWSLAGAGCSGASCGTIDSDGLYTAPDATPDPATVIVKATSAADPSRSASATVTILGSPDSWCWVSGSDGRYQAGSYGTQGVPAASNVPGSRIRTASWMDTQGRLWLFGGEGADSDGYIWTSLNDLWRFDPESQRWTWISGSPFGGQPGSYGIKGQSAPANVPGARAQAMTWIDGGGRFWLFGGYGYVSEGNAGELNDLWRYDPAANEWTWISGSAAVEQAGVYGTKGVAAAENVPGARTSGAAWTDSVGNLWLFGGEGYDAYGYYAGSLNDLWKFDPATLQWTWVSGSDVMDELGRYGTKGMAGAGNVPGARTEASFWIDGGGALWLFGGWGWGADFEGNCWLLNDLWRFDPAALEWTWISGSDTVAQAGSYGTKGVGGPSNVPGARHAASAWLDAAGNLWLFGGAGYFAPEEDGMLDDLWKYDPAAGEWTWIAGPNLGGRPGIYGTKGMIDPTCTPGGRNASASWMDQQGRPWLFGGYGVDATGQDGLLNDLWRFER